MDCMDCRDCRVCVRRYRAANADVDIGSPCTLASAHTCADAQLEQLISDAQLLSYLKNYLKKYQNYFLS
jgi:hypothetical protein